MREPFNSAFMHAKTFYDVDMTPEFFEEAGLVAWQKIGNKEIRLYRYEVDIDKTTLSVQLPCNADYVEAVTYNFEDWNYSTRDTVNGDYESQFTENYIETRKLFNSLHYQSGKFAKYKQIGDTLYFDKDYGTVNILYRGIVLDDEGLPYINEKEKDAIACYCAYTIKFKEGWRTNNANIIQLAQLLEQKWIKLCDAARVPVYINQNELNEILDVKTSWDRKRFNKSFKYVH